jgi:flavin reductase (DIM6/NTAB) family NADH-FMN oxidoreductase RutF
MQNRPHVLPVDLAKSYRLLNHGPTVLVTSKSGDKANVMAAAWSMPLDFSPPKVTVVIDRNTLTRELVEASGEFALNIPSRALAQMTLAVGSKSGREYYKLREKPSDKLSDTVGNAASDKFAEFGIATFAAEKIAAPLIEGCLGWLECRVIPEPHNQERYDLFIGEIVAAWADPRAFKDGHWSFEQGTPRSIHYIAGGNFFETGVSFEID